MSSSIAIPSRSGSSKMSQSTSNESTSTSNQVAVQASPGTALSSSGNYLGMPGSINSAFSFETPSSFDEPNFPESIRAAKRKEKGKGRETPAKQFGHERRTSWLSKPMFCSIDTALAHCSTGSSLAQSEHTVVDIGHPDGVPRLVSKLSHYHILSLGRLTFNSLPDYVCQSISRLRLES